MSEYGMLISEIFAKNSRFMKLLITFSTLAMVEVPSEEKTAPSDTQMYHTTCFCQLL